MSQKLELRYGMNPHQKPAWLSFDGTNFPLKILNGKPGYINLLDAFNSWQLVRDLKLALDLPAAASFKHVSPAGAAVAVPLNDSLKKSYFVEHLDLSPQATAYARARGADRISSFGDWIALSHTVDISTAELIRLEVSDGIIAPSFDPKALNILKRKKKGNYAVIQIDETFEPEPIESRNLFGLTINQQRNSSIPTFDSLKNVVTEKKYLPENVQRDLLVALIALKYTQSNSITVAMDGQLIGVGAGQQSRIHCTRLAALKAETWLLRQHPKVLNLPFQQSIRRPDRDNAIDQYLLPELSPAEEEYWVKNFLQKPTRMDEEEKRDWVKNFSEISLGSDAFFPFRDSIDRAKRTGVKYVAQPGGSVRDDNVIDACNEYGMAMAFTGMRLFHH